jgi:hypothetical protein
MKAPRRSPKLNHTSVRPVAPFPKELRHFAKALRLKLLQNGLRWRVAVRAAVAAHFWTRRVMAEAFKVLGDVRPRLVEGQAAMMPRLETWGAESEEGAAGDRSDGRNGGA